MLQSLSQKSLKCEELPALYRQQVVHVWIVSKRASHSSDQRCMVHVWIRFQTFTTQIIRLVHEPLILRTKSSLNKVLNIFQKFTVQMELLGHEKRPWTFGSQNQTSTTQMDMLSPKANVHHTECVVCFRMFKPESFSKRSLCKWSVCKAF